MKEINETARTIASQTLLSFWYIIQQKSSTMSKSLSAEPCAACAAIAVAIAA
ncbi:MULTISPECIES: hypothetical protein [unclassified Planococcus (in: firmicutes)]|uniref:hypothetical protein n=1 Tax=unclassified Planococcus (in: firmicutes) TaxID=2662419 RepID=UPI001E346937|nr:MULTISPECIES: hypothetical protein [unclassified Planococcus (in: firmicutes)]